MRQCGRCVVSPPAMHTLTTDPDQVKVTVRNMNGNETHFHVKRHHKVTKLKVSSSMPSSADEQNKLADLHNIDVSSFR